MRLRVMISVLGGLLGVAVVTVAGWFLWERALVWIAGYQFQHDLGKLKQITFSQNYVGACAKGDSEQTQPVSGVQLRFTSDTTYVIEPVCTNTMLEAEPLFEGALWGGVKRLYGSGIYIPLVDGNPEVRDGWVELVAGTTTIAVGYFDGQTGLRWQVPTNAVGGASPAVAGCADWGFECCELGSSQGFGAQVFPADCVAQCYQSCNQRPVVLFFNSDPMMGRDRSVFVRGANVTVQFGFEVVDFDGAISHVQINFGDGQMSPPFSAKEVSVIHDYECHESACSFEAIVQAQDDGGTPLADSQTNRIRVNMQP